MAIEYIDIVCHNHTDYGYTDHPLIAASLLSSYIYEVLDAVEQYRYKPDGERFCWTCETLRPVMDFYNSASLRDRERFTKAVQEGLIEVSGLPYNVTSLFDAAEWKEMVSYLPKELKEQWGICLAMQNDINGLARGGMQIAWDAGITSVWVGPNTYNGAPPLPTPALFDWCLDDTRTMRVWINSSYCDGFFIFEDNWRQGPVPEASDLLYRRPEPGDFFRTDEISVQKAHKHCTQILSAIEGIPGVSADSARDGFTQNKIFGGYRGKVLGVSVTNQWRVDNDPPCPWISDFVSSWNARGLRPILRLRTAGAAMREIADGWCGPIRKIRGEWTDWWANGSVSMPAELAAVRKARRICRVWGSRDEQEICEECSAAGEQKISGGKTAADPHDVLNEIILFNEHSFGSWRSVGFPGSDKTLAQQTEKSTHAYRALALAEKLRADQARILELKLRADEARKLKLKWNAEEAGKPEFKLCADNRIIIMNPSGMKKHARICLPKNSLRTEKLLWRDEETKEYYRMEPAGGRKNFMRPEKESDFSFENISRTFSDHVPDQTAVLYISLEPGQTKVLKPAENAERKNEKKEIQKTDAGKDIAKDTAKDTETSTEADTAKNNVLQDFVIEKNELGWPFRITVKITAGITAGTTAGTTAGECLLLDGACGDFLSVTADGLSPRWTFRDIFDTDDYEERKRLYRTHIKHTEAVYERCTEARQEACLFFTQRFSHPSILYGTRTMTLNLIEKTVSLEVSIYRKEDLNPQILYLAVDSPVKGKEVWTSNAGMCFRPGADQMPGSCMDYYGIDEWVWFGESPSKNTWLIASADTPLVAFGEVTQPMRRPTFTEHPEHLYYQIYDNTWDTNFPANESGKLTFHFKMAAGLPLTESERISADLLTDPVVIVRTGY